MGEVMKLQTTCTDETVPSQGGGPPDVISERLPMLFDMCTDCMVTYYKMEDEWGCFSWADLCTDPSCVQGMEIMTSTCDDLLLTDENGDMIPAFQTLVEPLVRQCREMPPH